MGDAARLENGYTRIANELLEAVCRYPWSSGAELRVVTTVIRLTYGYNRGSAAIGLGRFTRLTGLPQRTVERCLARLVEANILQREQRHGEAGSRKASVWRFNKRPGDWSWPAAGGEVRQARPSRYVEEPSSAPAEPAPEVVRESSEAVPIDALTRELMAEGFRGLALAQEHRRRLKARRAGKGERTDTGDGASAECTDSGVGASEQRTDSGDGTVPSRARARDVPTARSDQRTDSPVGAIKDTRKDTPLTPHGDDPPASPATTNARSPGGPAGPAGGAEQTRPAAQDRTPERQPGPPPAGAAAARRAGAPRHVADTLPRALRGDADR